MQPKVFRALFMAAHVDLLAPVSVNDSGGRRAFRSLAGDV